MVVAKKASSKLHTRDDSIEKEEEQNAVKHYPSKQDHFMQRQYI